MRVVYKNKLISLEVFKDRVEKKERCRIVERNVAVILGFIDKRHILLERHYRAPIGKWIFELPAGHIEKGETPISAAKKELLEETGYSAKNLKLLYKDYVAPGILTTISYTYVATGLTKMHRTDEEEMLRVKAIELNRAYALIKSNVIIDKKTISGLLYYKETISQKADKQL